MFLSANQNIDSVKKWAVAIFIWLFIVTWIIGMFAITAQACRNERNEGLEKLRFCNLTILASSVLPGKAEKRALLFLERGIARAQLNEIVEAAEDMTRAISDASWPLPDEEVWMRKLFKRIEKEDATSPAHLVWQKVWGGIED